MNEKTIFNKGGFKLLLGRMNDLYLEMPVLEVFILKKYSIKIFLYKRIHVVITLKMKFRQWLNGKLWFKTFKEFT